MTSLSSNPSNRPGQPPKPPARVGSTVDETIGQKLLMGTGIGAGVALLILILILLIFLMTFHRRAGAGGEGGGSAGTGGGTGGGSGSGEGTGAGADSKAATEAAPDDSQSAKSVGQGGAGDSPSKATETSSATPSVATNEHVFSINRVEPSASHPPNGGTPGDGSSGGGRDFDQRLKREGAKTGDVQISLLWNNYNDLDLHVRCPSGEMISYQHRHSGCGGELDVDMNAGSNHSDRPVENIYWPSGGAPKGQFRVLVNHYRNAGQRDPTEFKVAVKVDGRTRTFSGRVSFGDAAELVHTFDRR